MSASEKIRLRVEEFVRDIEGLVREAALEAVAEALGQPTTTKSAKGPRRKLTSATAAPAKRVSGKPQQRVRRTESEISADIKRISEFVGKHPGKRAEDIKAALGLSSQQWALPVRRLISEGRLTTRGDKRSTAYFGK